MVSGPRPGSVVREGSHKVTSRMVHGRRVLATCRFRYNVIGTPNTRLCYVVYISRYNDAFVGLTRIYPIYEMVTILSFTSVRKCSAMEVGPGVKAQCPQGNAWGASCNLTCEDGYQLDGPSSTECGDSLEWSGIMPQCIGQ